MVGFSFYIFIRDINYDTIIMNKEELKAKIDLRDE